MYKSIIIFLIISLLSCKNQENKKEDSPQIENEISLTKAQIANAKISISTVQNTKQKNQHRAFGKVYISPENIVSISSFYGGTVTNIQANLGSRVSQGQLLATVTDPQFIQLQQDYLLAKARYKFSKLDYDRQKDLNASHANSDKVYQQSESENKSNYIMVKSLAEKLRLLGINPDKLSESNISKSIYIKSPIAGVITKVNVNRGKYISPSEPMFEVVNSNQPMIIVKLYEKDNFKVSKGMKAVAYNHSRVEEKFQCEVVSINNVIQEDGGIEAICKIVNGSNFLIQNMSMVVDFELSSSELPTVSESSIVDFEGKKYVFIALDSQKFQMVEIHTGNIADGRVEILDMDKLNRKKIVENGAYAILMAMKNVE